MKLYSRVMARFVWSWVTTDDDIRNSLGPVAYAADGHKIVSEVPLLLRVELDLVSGGLMEVAEDRSKFVQVLDRVLRGRRFYTADEKTEVVLLEVTRKAHGSTKIRLEQNLNV